MRRLPILLLAAAVLAGEPPARPDYSGTLVCTFPVRDPEASAAWYRDVLGFGDSKGALTTPVAGVTLRLVRAEAPVPVAGTWLTFGVKDVDAARKRLAEQEVALVGETVTIPGLVKLLTFRDPDGHRFKLYQLLQEGAPDLPSVGALGYTKALVVAHETTDFQAAQKWYADVLGFRLFFQVEQMGWCEMGTPVRGVSFGLQRVESRREGGGAELAWGVRDAAAARAVLERHEVRLEEKTGPGTVSFRDADGNRMSFRQEPGKEKTE